jgi:hypothetical protein
MFPFQVKKRHFQISDIDDLNRSFVLPVTPNLCPERKPLICAPPSESHPNIHERPHNTTDGHSTFS